MNKVLIAAMLLMLQASVFAAQPKLILQITVDQLRGDLLHRYQKNFINKRNRKGFNRFLEQGVIYTNTHYRHAATLTAVGHATLATGALPSQHGIIANDWYDVVSGQKMYCVADAQTSLLNEEGYSASPANLKASTFSDQLHFATTGKAKIYSVSIKDRGAVLTGGHFGKSFWYNKSSGNFVTSSYYFDELPSWVIDFNQSGLKDSYLGAQWKLSLPAEQYHNNAKNRLYQIPPKGFQRGFPHNLPKMTSPSYYRMLTYTPFGDAMTIAFAKHIITTHELGKDDIPDYLSVSFSVNDYVGHNFGPNSIEAEDNLIKLDAQLAELFYFLDKGIGMENVLIVLSADHGVDAIPEYKASLGFAGLRANIADTISDIGAQLADEFELDQNIVKAAVLPNVYLDYDVLNNADLDVSDMRERLAAEIEAIEGIAQALTYDTMQEKRVSLDPRRNQMINNFMARRSGDITLIQDTSTMTGNYAAATHGSPYRYDTHVPMYFAGWNLKPKRVTRLASPEDVAVTLSSILAIGVPDKATGTILPEIAQ